MNKVIVIGGGAAGMVAAGFAARAGHRVTLLERNPRVGRKLMITGKGRCNLSNDCELDEFMANVPANGRFLYSALSAFGPRETMEFFESLGVPLKVERGRRVFPVSDKAVDIVDALFGFVKKAGVTIVNEKATGIDYASGAVSGVFVEGGGRLACDTVIVCTGGLSYPLTGSTGDGYEFARAAGHSIVPLRPSLVPLVTIESWPGSLMGLSLKNVTLTAVDSHSGKRLFEELGEMLFTHFGVSGPLVLSASAHMRGMEAGRYHLGIDLKPGLSEEQLDARLQRDFLKYSNSDFINSLHSLLPQRLIPVIGKLSEIDPHLKSNQLTREMRHSLVALLKNMPMEVKEFRPVAEAVVTSGGVKTSEVNPKTMESKLVKGLRFAGEILDVDAYTGGFNLQIAFSTGVAAAKI